MNIRVFHFRKKCIGCYACVQLAPTHWRMSRKDGKSVLLGAKEKKGVWMLAIGEEEHQSQKNTEKICPAKAIQVVKYS